jgi:cytoskeleton protein RodZ
LAVSIGESLAAARERAGLTVQQVSAKTRVRASLIEAMERDDFSGCGGDFYARGHLRNVAAAIGVDPTPLVAEYDRGHGRPSAPPPHEIFEPDVMPAGGGGPNWSVAMAIALVLVIGYGLVALFSGGDDDGTPVAEGNRPQATATASPSPSPSPEPTRTTAQVRKTIPADTVEIRLVIDDGESWVKITGMDGQAIFQGLLAKGQTKVWRHENSVKVVLGNAGVVRLEVNGKNLGTIGSEGEVLRRTFAPDEYRS